MVYIILADGFEEAEALIPADLLRRAGMETALVSVGDEFVTGAHGITVKTDVPLAHIDLSKAEMLVLPGGLGGVNEMCSQPTLQALLQVAQEQEIWIAAICAAPTLLAKWGVLNGKKAVCYPGMEGQLTGAEAQPGQAVVVDGKIITARAAGSGFDFALAMIEALAGPEKAKEVQHAIHY